MTLKEIKCGAWHYFVDENMITQGELRVWHANEIPYIRCYYKDGEFHGEYKNWNKFGKLQTHTFDIDGREIIDFLKNPELYPTTPEEKTMFALKYGNAPFISEGEVG